MTTQHKLKQQEIEHFSRAARTYATLPIASRVNALGGYGPDGEVIYLAHPQSCPSVLMASAGAGKATFMSNGSVEFSVTVDPFEVKVLSPHYDAVEKHEIGPPSASVWLATRSAAGTQIASLQSPGIGFGAAPLRLRIVKRGDPERAMWFLAEYAPTTELRYRTAVCLRLVATPVGAAILRQVLVENTGGAALNGTLWTCWHLHGTQRFAYNKEIWYDCGLPLSEAETVVSASVPYTNMMQIKRLSSFWDGGLWPKDATCDYLTFVGDTTASLLLPEAVRRGRMRPHGAGRGLNRFSTPTIAANQFGLRLQPGRTAVLTQSLLYVTDDKLAQAFRRDTQVSTPAYTPMAKAFRRAARRVVNSTPGCISIAATAATPVASKLAVPSFHVALPADKGTAFYLNSVWTGVEELYENCRAHGARMADGIELGTRDRGQDMWPKLKQDPGRVRADLLHALGFMYRTVDKPLRARRGLSLSEKLHGMFPRQYPSRWLDRSRAVMNDNRPYADSPLWLLNALVRLIRETGDTALLSERVGSVVLTNPDHPEQSGIRGADATFTVLEVVLEVLACFERHCQDSPYGMAQIMYGDWCDPIDMFGTGRIGDVTTRGQGTGAQTRLSCHLFLTLVEVIDLLEPLASVKATVRRSLQNFANRLRLAIMNTAWEGGRYAGFVDSIHMLRRNGLRPCYRRGELGYTLGSMRRENEFDGIPRRVLVSQAWGLGLLLTDRPWLRPVPDRPGKVKALLKTLDELFFDPALGLRLYTTPLANDENTVRLAGRMGIVPSGCAENGEYHHAQAMMHYMRLALPEAIDKTWRQFKPMLSSTRDERLHGPFDMPCTSYASDRCDPHFGAGMYFGLSGSTDWIVAIVERMAGIELQLHDQTKPDLQILPVLPKALKGRMIFRRVLHAADGHGGYKRIPLTLEVTSTAGRTGKSTVRINGKPESLPIVDKVCAFESLHIKVTR